MDSKPTTQEVPSSSPVEFLKLKRGDPRLDPFPDSVCWSHNETGCLFSQMPLENVLAKSFFKVLMPGFRKELSLPPAYSDVMNLEVRNTAILCTALGVCTVRICNLEGMFCFAEGWEEFVLRHELKVADFVIFTHKGRMTFEVSIFDQDGGMKEFPISQTPAERCNPKSGGQAKASEGNTRLQSSGPSGRKRHFMATLFRSNFSKRYPYLNIPASFAKMHGFVHRRIVKLKDDEGKIWTARTKAVKMSANHTRVSLARGWDRFLKAKKLKIGDTCIFRMIKNDWGEGRKPAPILMEVQTFYVE